MCGIAGVLDPARATPSDALEATASAMTETLVHRGPDDGGVWADAGGGVALGNRRLAIVDLSPNGHQPMHSPAGRFTLVFNGEIYDHRVLRGELAAGGHRFRGRSDTEVLLAAIEAWGLERALRRANGMFALALWDARERRLHLARDRIGEKPLYYGWAGDLLVFGSELKALRAHPAFAGRLSRQVLTAYLRYTFVPGPHSIYEQVRQVPPGTVVTVAAGAAPGSWPEPEPFWSLREAAERGAASPTTAGPEEAAEELHHLLLDAVALRMEADVPLGAFLSGGVDSSTVAALMQAAAPGRPVRTFTVAMPEAGFDESREAAAVARHLGTDHLAVELSASDALAAVPGLATIYDEPFADPSQVSTLLVSQVARRHVTVALSGDGGDELFAGYNRHVAARSAWRVARRLPAPVRAAAASALLSVPPARWDRLAGRLGTRPDGGPRVRQPGDKVHKLGRLLRADGDDGLYRSLVSAWDDPSALTGEAEAPALATEPWRWPDLGGTTERILYLDTAFALPDGMLTKVDRASMAAGLEARVPLIDHRVVEYAFSLPLNLKIRDGKGKWLLRKVLRRYVPDRLIDRPKMGFDPPIGEWLRGPLRSWAEDLLDPALLAGQGLLDPAPIQARWRQHLAGERNGDYPLWAVLMFQSWVAQQ